MDLTKLADDIFQVSQELWVLHVKLLLVLLLVFTFLSFGGAVPQAGVKVRVWALVPRVRAPAQAGAGGGTDGGAALVVPPPVPVSVPVTLCAGRAADGVHVPGRAAERRRGRRRVHRTSAWPHP